MKGLVQSYQEASRFMMPAAVGMVVLVACVLTPWPGWVEASKSHRAGTGRGSAVTQGSLITVDDQGRPREFCPLTHTDVKIEVSGFLARARVTQQFENPFSEKIEAVYTFPLPQRAAVDEMTLTVGDRVVKAKIKLREEAQAIYEAARARGHVAGLLDQERPNIFTQSVTNILPGEKVTVTISYVERLQYEAGSYELAFPMVVGPRYIPGAPSGKQGGGWAPDTTRVPDGSRITPPVSPKETRAGHDLSLEVELDAGLRLDSLESPSHDISVQRTGPGRAHVRLAHKAVIPNRDFILKYAVIGKQIQHTVLTHRKGHDGFVTLILQPPDRVKAGEVTAKELVFVLDTSGSMDGFPIEKAKETMRLAMESMYPQDTFNLITFSGDTHILFPEPVPATKENVREALAFLESRRGSGGTEMMKAIRAALDPSDAQDHVRIVCFMTDGYVGNDMEILSEIRRHTNARVFAFGVGSSVNRYLIEEMGQQGNGDAEVITSVMQKEEVEAATKRLYDHLRAPLLTDITLDFGPLPVSEVYPARINDLFSGRPVVVTGRYTGAAKGTITLKGRRAGDAYVKEIPVEFAQSDGDNSVLSNLWARAKIEHLMNQDLAGAQQQQMKPELQKEITQLGLGYRLMTQFTSFVAVDERVVTEGGKTRTVQVPVELPEGVQMEGVWADKDESGPVMMAQSLAVSAGVVNTYSSAKSKNVPARTSRATTLPAPLPPPPPPPVGGPFNGHGSGTGAGVGTTAGYSVGGGVTGGKHIASRQDATEPQEARPFAYSTPEEKLLASKISPKLFEDYRCWKRLTGEKHIAGAKPCRVMSGPVEVELVLASGADVQSLKAAGFEVKGQNLRNRVRGKIDIDKLPALAALKQVRFIAPAS